ncbi:MAG: PAS domain S-box protein [Microcoleus sp. SU_5_3]|nr:PAS domain S-box protein [Microcoleus sp. SU_5_3]
MFHEFLYQEVSNLREKLAHLEREMQSQTWFKKLQALMGVISKIRESLELETIFKTTATEVRQLLNADRVAVYRFLPESEFNEGEVVSEDVLTQYSPSLGARVNDHCFGEQFAANYAKGYVQVVSDIYKARLSPCHLKILKRFQIRANLVIPLRQGQHLWGLLCIHQCGQPRNWQEDEIEFARQVGDHLAVAIYQAELHSQTQRQLAEIELAQQQLRESEQKYHQILDSIGDMVLVKGSQSKIIWANKAFRNYYGMSQQELQEIIDAPFANPDHTLQYIKDDTFVFETGQTLEIREEPATRHDGEVRLFSTVKTPIRNEDDRITMTVGISRDMTERKLAEEALQASETKYRHLVETSQDIIWSIDAIGRFTFLNPAVRYIYGYEPEEMLGRPFSDFAPPEQIQKDLKAFARLLAGESVFQHESVQIAKDGSIKYLMFNAIALFDESGNLVGTTGTATDITDRKLAQTELQHAQQFMESVLNTIPVGVVAKEVADLRFVLWNPAAEQLLSFSAAEVLGKNDYDFFPREQAEVFTAKDREVLASREILDIPEELIQTGEGETRIFHTKKTAILDREGNPQYLLAITEDVTDRKRGELALRQSEAQLRQQADREKLLNSLTTQIRNSLDFDSIITVAVQEIRAFMQIDRCNFGWYIGDGEDVVWEIIQESRSPELPNLIGRYPASNFEGLGEQLLRLETLRVDDIEQVSEPVWKQTVRSMGYQSVLAIPMQALSGVVSAVSCSHSTSVRPWTDSEVELLQAISVQLAIALNQAELYTQTRNKAQELEQTLQQLTKTQSQLIQSEKMSSLGQLVAGVAHEINNPVNFIYGNLAHANEYTQDLLNLIELYQNHYPEPVVEIQEETEAIELNFLVEDLPKLLSSMKVGADRIQQIVASLRTFSRMDEAEMKEVNIHDGIDSTLMILQHRLKAKHNHPEIQVIKAYGKLPLVECYAGQLNQVFMNILSNALDALEERDLRRSADELREQPSHIRIRTEMSPSGKVIIRIADNGPGMTESVCNRLFDPFFTTKPVGKGTGMGLSISYQIVTERHGGSLHCNSSPGQGAEFAIEIPLKANW